MKQLTPPLLSVLIAVALLCTSQARADSIRWRQTDCEVGEECEDTDSFEYRICTGFGTGEWLSFTDEWLAGEVYGGNTITMPPEATPPGAYIQMRTWRYDEEAGEDAFNTSEPKLYVPEPGLLLGLVVGIGVLALTRSRSRRAASSEPHLPS